MRVDSNDAENRWNPFGQFRRECENILAGAYSRLQNKAGTVFPKIDLASTLEDPPNEQYGQLASSLSFELARIQKTKPMTVASQIADEARNGESFELVESIEAAEPGYVNFRADILRLTQLTLDSITSTLAEIDENKRRLALLKKTKASDIDIVAVTKSLDEWVGVAAELRSKYPEEFDLLNEHISKDPDPQKSILDLIRKYEKGERETRSLIRRVSQMVLAGFEETLRRARIYFDQWDWESEMLWTGRVSELLDRLKETGLARSKGGSWELDVGKAVKDYDLREKLGLSPTFEVASLTLTRSDGTSLYPTRDIAYTLYKFEWAERVINVIGVEQSLAQLQVKVAVWILGHRKEAMNFHHFPIGLLVLEGQRMSARRGRYVTFDQLLDEAFVRAKEEVDKRSPDLPASVKDSIAERISISAVRYAMLSVEAVKSTNFVWDRALNFEANSAPFINYAYTRALGILTKLGKLERPKTFDQLNEPVEQNLILSLARFPEIFARSAEELNPTLLCFYANQVAQRFHEFYEKSDISHLVDEELKLQRAALVEATSAVLKSVVSLLGFELAERM